MEFALIPTFSIEIKYKSNFIIDYSDRLEEFFFKKNYGDGIKSFTIGVICVSSNFESFFKVQKPTYVKGEKVTVSKFTGNEHTIENSLSYDIKLDFEKFKNASKIEAIKYLSDEIINSLMIFDLFKSKIKDFNLAEFKDDLETCFNG